MEKQKLKLIHFWIILVYLLNLKETTKNIPVSLLYENLSDIIGIWVF